MKQTRHEYVMALLIVLVAVTGSAMILTIPAYFTPQDEASVWITVALGCAFLALVAVATRERRKHRPGHR